VKTAWLPEAVRTLDSQLAYIAERNPRAAIDMGDAIEAAVARLADYPESAPPGRVRGTREPAVIGTPCVVVYRVEPAAVVILRVLHGAQLWPSKQK
jgi:toxin ParE1/3/4